VLDFRKIGFTADAVNYPLTGGGKRIVAMHNGVSVEQMPVEFGYAPNAHMHQWMNALGERLDAGLPVKIENATRWLLPKEIGL
jgi:hypothetical protein